MAGLKDTPCIQFVVQQLAKALCGSRVSCPRMIWAALPLPDWIDGELRRGGPQLCKVHTSDQRMSEGPESRILVISTSLDQARAAVKRMFFFVLRCDHINLNTARSNTWTSIPQSSRPSSMIRPTCPLPTPSHGPSRTSTIPRTCTSVS